MKLLIRIIDKISGICGGLAGFILCAGLVLTCLEIFLRTSLDRTLFITDEYSGYLMCGLTFCGLSYTLRGKGHIRMTFLYKAMSTRGQERMNLICYAVGFLFSLAITWFTWLFFWDSVVTGSQSMQVSETYLAFPQFSMPFGACVMTLQFLAEFLRTVLVLNDDTHGLALHAEIADLGR